MNRYRRLFLSVLLTLFVARSFLYARASIITMWQDTLPGKVSTNVSSFILPAVCIGWGTSTLLTERIHKGDLAIRSLVLGQKSYWADDVILYYPVVLDAGLSLAGVTSVHSPGDKACLLFLASAINAIMVYPLKSIIGRQRPDGSDYLSFPSGHTSNAFVGAHYLWMEYNAYNALLAGSGYLSAVLTGYLRIFNDRHWFSDVLCGAGIGILSTKLAYLIYPHIKKGRWKHKKFTVEPLSSTYGMGIAIRF